MRYFLSLLLAVPSFSSAQKPTPVQTNIEKVTVFFDGAQVSRTGKITLNSGIQELVFKNLSPLLAEKTVQLTADKEVTLLSIQFRMEDKSEETALAKKSEEELLLQIRKLRDENAKDSLSKAILLYEEDVLDANKHVGGSAGLKAADMRLTLDFVRQRSTEIKTKVVTFNQAIKSRFEQIADLRKKLEKSGYKGTPMGEILVKVSTAKAGNQTFGLSYYVSNAGWIPSYDVRVTDVNHPMQLKRKASVIQATLEDWKNIKLTLSNSNPTLLGELPGLKSYFVDLGFPKVKKKNQQEGYVGLIEGKVMDSETKEGVAFAMVRLITDGKKNTGTVCDLDGKFKMVVNEKNGQLEIMSAGYGKKVISPIRPYQDIYLYPSTKMQEVSISSEEITKIPTRNVNQMLSTQANVNSWNEESGLNIRGARTTDNSVFVNGIRQFGSSLPPSESYTPPDVSQKENPAAVSYEIKEPYTIPCDGKESKVEIADFDIPVRYQYITIPKIDPYVYLTAELADWESLNLLPGDAAIYYENTYVGSSPLTLPGTDDTLKFNLGIDKQIVAQRTKIAGTSKRQLLGSNRIASREFEIRVRNNKSIPVTVKLIDQYPITSNSAYAIDRLEQSGGELDSKSGLLKWSLKLESGKEEKLKLAYNIKYPANAMIFLE